LELKKKVLANVKKKLSWLEMIGLLNSSVGRGKKRSRLKSVPNYTWRNLTKLEGLAHPPSSRRWKLEKLRSREVGLLFGVVAQQYVL
jgi:hypothetical protein